MVLRMEQGGILQHQLPIGSDYALTLDNDCSDHCGGSSQHDSFTPHSSIDTLRRDDSLTQHIPTSYVYASSQTPTAARHLPSRGVNDVSSYQQSGHFTDSNSGSISTSPSSAASSLAYTNYPGVQYTNIQQYPSSVQLQHSFVPPSFPAARPSAVLDSSTQSMLPHLSRPSTSGVSNGPERDTYSATSTPYLARGHLPSNSYSALQQSYPETPRLLSGTAALSLSTGYSYDPMAGTGAHGYATPESNQSEFPWSDVEVQVEMTSDKQLLVPKINIHVEKGFFFDDSNKSWTCYRRNYFSISCGYQLFPPGAHGRITIQRNNTTEHVQAMGMRLSAAVDGPDGKTIELVQHTPKRDQGPKTKIEVVRVPPTNLSGRPDQTLPTHASYHTPAGYLQAGNMPPGPYLPFQQSAEDDAQAGASQSALPTSQHAYTSLTQPPGTGNSHTPQTFERVQFKQATANNGKRRATQQYFHLIVELFADVRKNSTDKPIWVKVAQRTGERIVVRGRSPSHYQGDKTDGTHASSSRGITSGAYNASGGQVYSGMNTGGFRGLGSAYGNFPGSAQNFRSKADMQYSDGGSQSDSSGSSGEEGLVDTNCHPDTVMSDADRLALHEHEGYQYFPGTMYENVHHGAALPPLSKLEDGRFLSDKTYAVKTEYADAVPGAQYQANSCGRFQGVDTSRGYFPDLHTRF